MDFWIPLLGSALGGAVITSVFGLIKNRQDKADEHAQWLRNRKIDAYGRHLKTYALASVSMTQYRALLAPDTGHTNYEDMVATEIDLLASPVVKKALGKFDNAFHEFGSNFLEGQTYDKDAVMQLRLRLALEEKELIKVFRTDLGISNKG